MGGIPGQRHADLPDEPAAEPRRPSTLLPVNPFFLLDVVLRGLLPGTGNQPRPNPLRSDAAAGTAVAARLYTAKEAARRAGMSEHDMGRLWRALGFPELAEESPAFTDADIAVAREVAQLAADKVIDLDLVISMVRPMGHLVSRLGAAQVSALAELGEATPGAQAAAEADGLVPLLERIVVHAWRRHLIAAASAALPARGLTAASSAPRAVGFIDIASYTSMSRRVHWSRLAALLERFEACVFDEVASVGGRVVKTLGDEVLFVASDPAAGAEIALSVIEAGLADPELPTVHAGLAYGPLLERAGDVFGPTVNVASRVTGLARGGAVLVDTAFRNEIAPDRRFRTVRRPRRPVRGYPSLQTFRLERAPQLPAI
jgi:adenylate cyclase